jgi:hypothetical protein
MKQNFLGLQQILGGLVMSLWTVASLAGGVEPAPAAIPEPTTMMLLGAGIGAAALIRRLRK